MDFLNVYTLGILRRTITSTYIYMYIYTYIRRPCQILRENHRIAMQLAHKHGRRIFVDALSSAIWSLEFADLAERAAQKRRGFGSKTKHDFELLLFERVLKQDGGPPQDAIDAIARGCTVLSNCGIDKTSNQTYCTLGASPAGWTPCPLRRRPPTRIAS